MGRGTAVAKSIGMAMIEPLETQINATLDQTAFLFGIEFSAFVLAQVLFQAVIGSMSDRYGRKPFILGALVVLVPSVLAQGIVTTPLGLALARFVQGIAAAAVFAPAMALAGDLARGRNSGTTLSVLTMAFGLGTAVGPLSAGYLVEIHVPFGTTYAAPFALGAALAVVGFVLVYTQVDETVTSGAGGSTEPESVATD
ncbi:hypothetical protein GCM10009021_27600 [Halarchaeum nitratireducens]|uniref:Major facilitator superfamily (MFS) profile domain-containing protein n=1 Tax=Halarchaeum nitratireducens TaxID=489913 RepID=A0A830GES7_9EURY|nr:MFS family permease [Halarchaeum solikamskense]GGN24281.1 hypothetical protein GCM10009021_27600 [Halarchaeum nitratireducens]